MNKKIGVGILPTPQKLSFYYATALNQFHEPDGGLRICGFRVVVSWSL
ncbi:hypothetical protein [Scytonema sp. PCC 10023]